MRWLGSKLKPNSSRRSSASRARSRRINVEGDFRRVDFEAEVDAAFLEDVQDGVPKFGQKLVALVDHFAGSGRKIVDQVPDARAGEAIDHPDAELLGGPGGVLHFLDGPAADAVGFAVTPDVGGNNSLVAGVDIVEDALADEVVGDGKQFEIVFFEQVAFAAAIRVVGDCFVDFKMVAPAGQFEAVVSEISGLFAQRFQREIGPLTGKKCDGASHVESFPDCQFGRVVSKKKLCTKKGTDP